MDQNVLSPEQRRKLQVFKYDFVNSIEDDKLSAANQDMVPVLAAMKTQNDVLQKNANTLQALLEAAKMDPTTDNDVLREQIKWNTYFYKKYTYQTRLMWILIVTCIIINVLNKTTSTVVFAGVTGLLLAVVFIYMIYQLWDLTIRDSLNFDEYSFYNYTGAYLKNDNHTDTIDVSNCRMNKIAKFYA